MRIAMVGPFGFHPNKTMRSRALPLARALVSAGDQVKIFMPPWQTPEEEDRNWSLDGVDIRYVRLSGGVPGITWRLAREVTAWKPDVVHIFKPKAYSGLVGWTLWHRKRKQIYQVVDTDDWEGWGGWNDRGAYTSVQKQFFAWQEDWGLRHNHRLTVASRTLQSLIWGMGVPAERVTYLPNGPGITSQPLDIEQKKKELGLSGHPVLLIYSRFFEFEITRLLRILISARKAVPDLKVLLVGLALFEEESSAMQAALDRVGLAEIVLNMGWLEESQLPPVLATADVGLYLMDDNLLNRTKCPVKLADLLSLGIPVVAEGIGQVGEYVLHQQTGLIYQCGDAAGIVGGVTEILTKPEYRQKLSAAAESHIKDNFSWSHLAQIAREAYRSEQ